MAGTNIATAALTTGGDDTAALQASLDAASSAGSSTGATLYVPGSTLAYTVSSPVFLGGNGANNVTVRGDGAATKFVQASGYSGPVFAVGMPWRTCDARYRPDVSGWLDGTQVFAPWTNPRRGVCTAPGSGLTPAAVLFAAHRVTYGTIAGASSPSYWNTGQLTVDTVVGAAPGGPWVLGDLLFGFYDGSGPAPWHLKVGGSTSQLQLNATLADGTQRSAAFTLPGSGPWRVSVQCDYAAGTWNAWASASGVPTLSLVGSGTWAATPGAVMSHDGVTPFSIGRGVRTCPVTVGGLRVTNGLPYTFGAATVTATDRARLFSGNSGPTSVAVFDMYEASTSPPPGYVTVEGGLGWFAPDTPPSTTSNLALRDLTALTNGQPAVLIGAHLGLSVDRVNASGGLQGLGTLNGFPVGYVLKVNDCQFQGSDTPMALCDQTVWAARNTLTGGSDAGRFLRCTGNLVETFVPSVGAGATTVVDWRGDVAKVDRLVFDNESGSGSLASLVRFTQGGNAPQRIQAAGLHAAGTTNLAALKLVGFRTAYPVSARLGGVTSFSTLGARVSVTGPAGSVVVEADAPTYTGGGGGGFGPFGGFFGGR